MANRLAQEKSLYLRQHAYNPVDWWPWCSEAFEAAQKEGKPILLSIGYAACHWCHVMAHECFEDDYIAGIMNKHFICIKVDREERPEIDQIYMEAVQMITQQAGWPLNVFCFPDGRPFFGGTYFPAEDKGQGLIPWPQLLMRIKDHYNKKREELEENADNILKNLQISEFENKTSQRLDPSDYIHAAQFICTLHDDDWGGFGRPPKFPPSSILDFLLSIRATRSCEETSPALAQRIDSVVLSTLKAMAHGGIFDQLGGGFMRYSVDRYWLIPHFEKMLYDNALLINIYTKAYLRYRDPLFKAIVEETIAWLEREMLLEDGLFASSIDADSEGREGAYYVWSPEEVKAVLGKEDGGVFCYHYNITSEGNFEAGYSNPAWATDSFEQRKSLKILRDKLLQARKKRVAPLCDSKKLLSWNSLLIKSLVEAGFAFKRKDWVEKARIAAEAVEAKMRWGNARYYTVLYEDKAMHPSTLEGYVFYAEACLALVAKGDWLEIGLSEVYLKRAAKIVESILIHFSDNKEPGFFSTADDHERLIVRKKDLWDNATPSANSILISVLSSLYIITGEARYKEALDTLRGLFVPHIKNSPQGISYTLSNLVQDMMGIAILYVNNEKELELAQEILTQKALRKIFILKSDKKTPQLCVGTQCIAGPDNIEALIKLL